MSSLERKWWFIAPVAFLSVLLSFRLLSAAGMPLGAFTASQWIVFFLCCFAVSRLLTFVARIVILRVSPRARAGL